MSSQHGNLLFSYGAWWEEGFALGRMAHSWASLRQTARVQRRVSATFRRADGRTLHVRKATQPEAELRAIYDALGLNPTPGHLEKTIA